MTVSSNMLLQQHQTITFLARVITSLYIYIGTLLLESYIIFINQSTDKAIRPIKRNKCVCVCAHVCARANVRTHSRVCLCMRCVCVRTVTDLENFSRGNVACFL